MIIVIDLLIHVTNILSKLIWESISYTLVTATWNTQVPRYLLFCEGGIYSTHGTHIGGYKAHILYRENVVNVVKKYISLILQINNA